MALIKSKLKTYFIALPDFIFILFMRFSILIFPVVHLVAYFILLLLTCFNVILCCVLCVICLYIILIYNCICICKLSWVYLSSVISCHLFSPSAYPVLIVVSFKVICGIPIWTKLYIYMC